MSQIVFFKLPYQRNKYFISLTGSSATSEFTMDIVVNWEWISNERPCFELGYLTQTVATCLRMWNSRFRVQNERQHCLSGLCREAADVDRLYTLLDSSYRTEEQIMVGPRVRFIRDRCSLHPPRLKSLHVRIVCSNSGRSVSEKKML